MSQFTTYRALKEAVEKARRDISALGYPELLSRTLIVGTSTRPTQWLGQTTYQRKGGKEQFILKFNIPYMMMVDDKEALSTIYHEVAHTIKGGMTHKGAWLKCATQITSYLGINVSRLSPRTAYSQFRNNLDENRIKYVPVCCVCGFEHRPYLTKSGRVVKSILENKNICKCAKCGSKHLTIETKYPQF